MPFVSLTRATLRSAEFGFLGVVVYTRVHTPRFCGHAFNAGAPVLLFCGRRPCRTSWLKVGTVEPPNTFRTAGSRSFGVDLSSRRPRRARALPRWDDGIVTLLFRTCPGASRGAWPRIAP